MASSDGPKGVADVERWLAAAVVEHLKVSLDEVHPDEPFARYGADSLTLVTIGGELEEWLDISISPSMMWQYPTIGALARALVNGPTTGLRETVPPASEMVDLEDLSEDELLALLEEDSNETSM